MAGARKKSTGRQIDASLTRAEAQALTRIADESILEQKAVTGLRENVQRVFRLVYWNAFPLVPVLIALLIFPSPYLCYGFLGVPFLFLLRWLAEGAPFPSTPVNFILVVFLAAFAFGLAFSPAADRGVLLTGHVLAGITLFFVIVDRARLPDELWTLIAILVALGVGIALAAPFGTVWMQTKIFQFPEFYNLSLPHLGETSLANNVAGGLEVAVPFAIILLGAAKTRLRLPGAIALPPLLLMLVLLQSRSALVAVAVGITVLGTLYRRWLLPLVPLTLLGALALNSFAGNPLGTQSRLLQNLDATPETIEGRSVIWQYAVPLLVRAPLGLGAGGFRVHVEEHQPSALTPVQRGHAHNLFLQIGLDTGWLGLAAFVLLWFYAVRSTWQAYGKPETRLVAMGVLGAFAVILVHGTFDLVFWGAKPGIFLWATIGLGIALGRLQTTPKR